MLVLTRKNKNIRKPKFWLSLSGFRTWKTVKNLWVKYSTNRNVKSNNFSNGTRKIIFFIKNFWVRRQNFPTNFRYQRFKTKISPNFWRIIKKNLRTIIIFFKIWRKSQKFEFRVIRNKKKTINPNLRILRSQHIRQRRNIKTEQWAFKVYWPSRLAKKRNFIIEPNFVNIRK